jgi:hypothetical protein
MNKIAKLKSLFCGVTVYCTGHGEKLAVSGSTFNDRVAHKKFTGNFNYSKILGYSQVKTVY